MMGSVLTQVHWKVGLSDAPMPNPKKPPPPNLFFLLLWHKETAKNT